MRGLRFLSLAGVLVGSAVAASPAVAAPLNMTPDRTWQVANGRVLAIAVLNGRVYVGGTFTRVAAPRGGSATRARAHLAAFSQKTGRLLAWAPKTNGTVWSLVARGNSVYAGGDFTRVNGHAHGHVVALGTVRGRVRRGWRAGTDDIVRALAANSTTLFLGGDFHHVNHRFHRRLAAVSLADGRIRRWTANAGARVTALAVSPRGGALYAGGAFTVVNRKRINHLAKISAKTGRVLSWRSHPNWIVWSIAATRTRIYVGGGGEGGHVAAYSTRGRRLWLHLADGDVQSVSAYRGNVYAAGHFDHFCTTNKGGGNPWKCAKPSDPRHKLFVLSAKGSLGKWAPQASGSPIGAWVIKAGPRVEVGGEFTRFGPHNALVDQRGFAQFSR
jgi:hypothetical protein